MLRLCLRVTLLLIAISVVSIIAARLIGEQRPRDWLAFNAIQGNLHTVFVSDIELNLELNVSAWLRRPLPPCNHGSPAWSWDGRLALVEYCGGYEDSNIRIVDFRTASNSYLHRRIENEHVPSWSPDGRIAFITEQDRGYHLYISDPITGTFNDIANTNGDRLAPSWSNDGKLAFLGNSPEIGLYVRDTQGQIRLIVPKVNQPNVAWSPNGRRLAYMPYNNDVELKLDLAVFDLATSQSTAITDTPSPISEYNPIWLLDGRLTFSRYEDSYTNFYIFDPNTGAEVNVTGTLNGVMYGVWAPDGQHLAISTLRGWKLQVLDVNSHRLTDIYTSQSEYGSMAWAK